MNEHEFYSLLLTAVFLASPLTVLGLLYISAPYGRHFRQGWGPRLDAKTSWFLMETAAILSFDIAYFLGDRAANPIAFIFFMLWQAHYFDRAVLYPLRLPEGSKQMPVTILSMGFLFNVANGYLNGRYLTEFGPAYTWEWLLDIRFVAGVILFTCGFMMNRYADAVLLSLRKPGETGYKIPYGHLFDYVSCPNYLGEVIEWFGWAMATWSLPGLAFALFAASNLIPRAYAHHCWYRSQFTDYPRNRKAVIPFIL